MDAQKITRQSGSNLALAFVALGRERREDITLFYAFCRIVDDIADDTATPPEEKQRALDLWRRALAGETAGEPALAADIRALIAKYRMSPSMFEEIIDGVEMDLRDTRYETWEELRQYCYRVASAVGLVSIEIFGYKNPRCRQYAIDLGLALQTTNIVRDVAKDVRMGRIYLPREEMTRFGYGEAELRSETYNDAFVSLMQFQAARSREFYESAVELLPREDRRSMVAAEIMRSVYQSLLAQIERDRFRVFECDYGLTKWQKARRVLGQLVKIA